MNGLNMNEDGRVNRRDLAVLKEIAKKYDPDTSKFVAYNERNPKMKNITINVPVPYINTLQDMIRAGIIPSRSEGIRIAVRDFLHKEIAFYEKLIKGNDVKIE